MPSWHLELSQHPAGGAIDLEILKRKSWPGIVVQFVRIAAPFSFDLKVTPATHFVALHDLYRADGETFVDGLPPHRTKNLRGKLTYLPAGCALRQWCRIEKPGTIMTVTIEPKESTKCPIATAKLAPRAEFEDQMVRSVLLRFQAILDDPSLDAPGYAETLGELLVFELNRVASPQHPQRSTAGGLSASQLRLVTEYIDRHLTQKTPISELAALVDLTRFHFIRSFKQAAGVPPHQFMIQRRVDRAKELLAERDNSIADVAARTGFGTSVQLTRAFHRVVGTTPSAFRRDIW